MFVIGRWGTGERGVRREGRVSSSMLKNKQIFSLVISKLMSPFSLSLCNLF